jgi:hypothetical protein
MSNPIVKKVTIKKQDLPALNGVSQNYLVRYRIVSEDRNRTSHWSPRYKVNVEPEIDRDRIIDGVLTPEDWIPHSVVASENKQIINVVWTTPANLRSDFDLYVKWGADDFKYVESIQTSSYSIIVPSGYSAAEFALQVATFPKERFTKATLFESDPVSLVV